MGHNIYILCHQLAQHNKELASLLKPNSLYGSEVESGQTVASGQNQQQQQQQQQQLLQQQNQVDPRVNRALVYYASHTAQIEVQYVLICVKSQMVTKFIIKLLYKFILWCKTYNMLYKFYF